MDSGLNMTMATWGSVPSEVATFTRVCTYDRAGLGFSESGPEPRTSKRIVNELHTLLVNAGVGGPYVLVGHSLGGLNVRLYASLYPKEVAGIVLVDASHEAQYEKFASLKSPTERQEYLRHESGGNHERVNLLASAAEVQEAPALPSVPVLVLTARQGGQQDPQVAKAVEDMQADLAKLAPNSKQIIVENSGHFIQLDRHFLVTDSIFVVVSAARNHSASL
jgi:pimeloyl-ACP methyl ester carboxylesterase